MFVKVFKRIHDSSIANDHIVRLVFMDFLILADRDGVVDMTPEAFSRRTNVPLETVRECIEKLMMPDPTSNTPDHEGKRLLPLTDEKPWGWQIVNYEKYRAIRNSEEIREQTRLRVAKYRKKHSMPALETLDRFDEFWRIYPRREAKTKAMTAWKPVKPDEVDLILKDVCDRAVSDDWKKEAGKYVPLPATYLNQRRWEDETKPPQHRPNGELRGGEMNKDKKPF